MKKWTIHKAYDVPRWIIMWFDLMVIEAVVIALKMPLRIDIH